MKPYIVLWMLWGIIVFLLSLLLIKQYEYNNLHIECNRNVTEINKNIWIIAEQLKIDEITIIK